MKKPLYRARVRVREQKVILILFCFRFVLLLLLICFVLVELVYDRRFGSGWHAVADLAAKEKKMLFDFEEFTKLVKLSYRQNNSTYTLDEVLEVFKYYFETYELVFNKAHPLINFKQISGIINKMPYFNDTRYNNGTYEYSPEEYKSMINKHFTTKYRKCDYNINHFFSGKIRELRFYEVCY